MCVNLKFDTFMGFVRNVMLNFCLHKCEGFRENPTGTERDKLS